MLRVIMIMNIFLVEVYVVTERKQYPIETPRGRGPYINNRRQEVIEAAIRLFSYHGYDGVTYQMISKEAGVANSSIHKLFGGKETLARMCAHQILETLSYEVDFLTSLNLGYAEHIEKVSLIFTNHKDELRFLVGLMVTPKNAHMTKGIWTDTFFEKAEIIRHYKDEIDSEDFYDVVYLMTALHFSFIMGGEKERYDSVRKKVIQKFLKGE